MSEYRGQLPLITWRPGYDFLLIAMRKTMKDAVRRESFARAAALAVIAMIAARCGAAPPSTSPDGTESDVAAAMRDVRAANVALNALLTPGTLADPVRRDTVAPKALPLLKRMQAGLDMAVRADPGTTQRVTSGQQQVLAFRLAFGDPDVERAIGEMTTNAGPAVVRRVAGARLLSTWIRAPKDPASQSPLSEALKKFARENADDEGTTILLMNASRSAATPELEQSLRTTAMEEMKNPTAAAIKAQAAAADAHKQQVAATLANRVGQPMMITGTTPDQKPFTTADWKGKVVLVDFWATWCGPCKAEMPRLVKLYDRFHKDGLEVVGVSNDYDVGALKAFVAANAMPWPQLIDAKAAENQELHPVTASFGIEMIPTMFLIDRRGVARSVSARGEMETLVPALLAEHE